MDVIKTVKAMIEEGAQKWQRLDVLDKALHWEFDPPYLPAANRSALAREYDALISRAELPILPMIVDALVDRLQVTGFRASGAEEPSAEVWEWWQTSGLDQSQVKVYRDAVGLGDGYVSITPDAGIPRFRPESPLSLSVAYDPADPMTIVQAVKVVGKVAWLYTDTAIYRLEQGKNNATWNVVGEVAHAAGVCPIVRFPNEVDSLGRSYSEIEPVLPIQARINQTVMDRLLLQRSQAWRQRWVAGIEVEKGADGRAIPPFETGADTLLVAPSETTKFGEFAQSDLDGLLKACDADVAAAAMTSRTPPHYLPQANISNVSEAALVALEAGFTSKVMERQALWGESWERTMRVGGAMVGVKIDPDAEVIWRDLELRSEAQKVDAATKLRTIGVPLGPVLERLGYTPQQIERIQAEAAAEALSSAAAQAKAFGVDGGMDGAEGGVAP